MHKHESIMFGTRMNCIFAGHHFRCHDSECFLFFALVSIRTIWIAVSDIIPVSLYYGWVVERWKSPGGRFGVNNGQVASFSIIQTCASCTYFIIIKLPMANFVNTEAVEDREVEYQSFILKTLYSAQWRN